MHCPKKLYLIILMVLMSIAAGPAKGNVYAEPPGPVVNPPTLVVNPPTPVVNPPAPVADPTWPRCPEESSQEFPDWFPRIVGAQYDSIYQNMPAFRSPYQGPNSLSFLNGMGRQVTQVYGLYLGSQLAPGLQMYADTEFFQGDGISNGLGLGGYVNGDVIRAGTSNLAKVPYVARLYLRYYYPLSGETEKLERGVDQLPGDQPVSRWEFKIGKLAPTDDLDLNRYANNNRAQFFNYDFLYNPAWDYASDTRGYTYGILAALYQPRWRVALGVYMEPNTDNGADFDFIELDELGYNLELAWKPNDCGTIVRLLTYFNEARMGSYENAIALGRLTGTTPSLLDVEKSGGTKYGFGLNFEQPLADGGETGLFGRLGWNDGNHETWAYTECDRHVSLGAQVCGIHWGRGEDRAGIAYAVDGLSNPHKDYLEAGGIGMLLGDGALNYALAQTLEIYYCIQLCKWVQLSPDFQFIQNPGYNSDRGPAQVYGLRLRLFY
jgi:hypothetical protein